VEAVAAAMPELPSGLRARLAALGLPKADVAVLTDEAGTGRFASAALDALAAMLAGGGGGGGGGGASKAGAGRGGDATPTPPLPPKAAKALANWVMGDVLGAARESGRPVDVGGPLPPGALAELVALVEGGTLSGKLGKALLPALLAGEVPAAGPFPGAVAALAKAKGLVQVSDPAAIAALVSGVLAAHPDKLAEFRGGKAKLQGFFVGELMKASGGKANPGLLNQELARQLKGE
jgi:aspartyl-tRNA(Asn)/glutamyl-tRNA(Gln) amidotransferase subunit B